MRNTRKDIFNFSCPYSSDGGQTVARFMKAYFQTRLETILDHMQKIDAEGLDSVLEYCINGLEGGKGDAKFLEWPVEIAISSSFFVDGETEDAWKAGLIQLAMLLAKNGFTGEWYVEGVSGEFCIDAVCVKYSYSVRCLAETDGQIFLEVDGGETIQLGKCNDIYFRKGATPRFVTFDSHSVPILYGDELGSTDLWLNDDERPFTGDMDFVAEDLQKNIDLIKRHAPEYYRWIANVLRYLVVAGKKADDSGLNRGDSNRPGAVYLSYPTIYQDVPSILVHECSHQYYFLQYQFFSPVNGKDNNEYYSPIKERNRPLDMILVAYHAFANVLLFTEKLIAQDIDQRSYYLKEQESLNGLLNKTIEPLRVSEGLSDSGVSLWKPLAISLGHL